MKPSTPQRDPPETQVDAGSAHLGLAAVERAVRAADPAVLLVLPRILRRVIKEDRRLTGVALRVPHRKSYLVRGQRLLEIVEPDELGLTESQAVPEQVILLPRPDPRKLDALGAGEVLVRCWRLLFHARVHADLEDQIARGRLTPAAVRQRIHEIGTVEFDEIRSVLAQEGLLLPPRTNESVYVEFAAVYLELKHFAWTFVPRYFPSIRDWHAIDRMLAHDVDADHWFAATRPEEAPAPQDRCPLLLSEVGHLDGAISAGMAVPASEGTAADRTDDAALLGRLHYDGRRELAPTSDARPSEREYYRLMARAQQSGSVGNTVRAAILRCRALYRAPPMLAERARSALKSDVRRLISRIQTALELSDDYPAAWHEGIYALVGQSRRGGWTPEARLLYDLQKVCVDCERGLYTVDLVEWIRSWGRRPIQRPLPHQRDVLVAKHLHSAANRLAAARLPDGLRRDLTAVLHAAMERANRRLRERFRPLLVEVLDSVNLRPENLPEEVAREKIIEELLDRVVDRGYLDRGHLRDALSRNNLKLPDLAGPAEDLLRGDQLLRADRRLAAVLDGVYRPAEFYLRWMQRLSSMAFGTGLGRFITRWLAMPFGGAYLALAFIHHMGENLFHVDVAVKTPASVLALGLFLLGVFNSEEFRHSAARLFKSCYHGLHDGVIAPMLWMVRSGWVQRIVHSRPFALGWRFLVKPALWAAAAWFVLHGAYSFAGASLPNALALFLAANLLLNSRVGRSLDEMFSDWLVQTWHRYGLRLLAGLFYLVVDLFKGILEAIDRLLYTVDEWLRFRTGDSRASLVSKAVLGMFWFGVTYVVRFCVTLLIEPQVNPIKHFPVVTVSHKLLFPLIPVLAKAFSLTIETELAVALATAIIWSIPGIFGFLVWELKENWRLYAANRPDRLLPVSIGHHGETMARLLKPGFHSGTVPKRFAKLRRAERKARAGGSWQPVRKHLHALQKVQASVRRFLDRELLALLSRSRLWQAPPVSVGRIRLGTNGAQIAFVCDLQTDAPLWISLEVESGWLASDVIQPGWAERLRPEERQILIVALMGLYKSMGVEMVRQQLETVLPPRQAYELVPEGIDVWLGDDLDAAVRYAIGDEPHLVPEVILGTPRRAVPDLERRQLVYRDLALRWDRWVTAWQQDQAGSACPSDWMAEVRILPDPLPSAPPVALTSLAASGSMEREQD